MLFERARRGGQRAAGLARHARIGALVLRHGAGPGLRDALHGVVQAGARAIELRGGGVGQALLQRRRVARHRRQRGRRLGLPAGVTPCHVVQQRGGAFIEGLREALVRRAQRGGEVLAGAFVAREQRLPRVGHAGGA